MRCPGLLKVGLKQRELVMIEEITGISLPHVHWLG